MKKINCKKDLAINGAPPAFEEPLHVGRPNIGDKDEFIKRVDTILESGWLSNNGPMVQELEKHVADYHHVKHCVAMCNGMVALEVAIGALDLTGEVIVPSYTFIATAHALYKNNIIPVFADIDPATHNLDPDSVRSMITPKTRGVLGVHIWGNPASIDELQIISEEYNLALMFDAAHAFGCSYKGKMIGNFGQCEVLSFHATKFFNTFEGGAVLTNNDELAEKMRAMRNFGFSGVDNTICLGTNGKLNEISAAMGLVNLTYIDQIIATNRANYESYREALKGLSGITVYTLDTNEYVNYQYIIVEVGEESPVSRDKVIEALHAENIFARKYFWPGCHNMQPYKQLFPDAELSLKNTRLVADRVIVLPTGTSINSNYINNICQIIKTLMLA